MIGRAWLGWLGGLAIFTAVAASFFVRAHATVPEPETVVPAPPLAMPDVRAEFSEIQASAKNAEDCHERMHDLGHRAFAQYGVAALDASNEACNAGYVHGVIESALASAADPSATMMGLCDASAAGTFSGWECFHGVGHGLMIYAAEDLPATIARCRSLGAGEAACVNGAYMENMVAEATDHPTVWRRADDSFFPCEEGMPGRDDCYLYAPVWYLSEHGHDAAAAMRWCEGAGDEEATCVEGVGSQAFKDRSDDPEGVVSVCDAAPEGFRASCIRGMASMVAFHSAALTPAEAWCQARTGDDQAACADELSLLAPLFD